MAALGEIPWLVRLVWNHPANRHGRVSAMARLVGWQFWKHVVGQPREFVLADQIRLRAWPDSTVASLLIYCRGRPDWDEMGLLAHYLRPGDAVIDVGANIGSYTLLAAKLVGAAGRVDAFEPAPRTAARLRENLALNGFSWVVVHEAAAGAEIHTVRFVDALGATSHIAVASEAGAGIEVPMVRLDDLLGERRYALAKLDIEGAELAAFQGAERMLFDGNPPLILLEINRSLLRFGYSEADLVAWLAGRGYRVGLYHVESRTFSWPDRPWLARENVVAVHEPSFELVRRRLELP
jgi:FkbM family methyltransferase